MRLLLPHLSPGRYRRRLVTSLVCLLVLPILAAAAEKSDDGIWLWSSTGGGWRAMFACVGYVNLFRQAGLLTAESSLLDAIVS